MNGEQTTNTAQTKPNTEAWFNELFGDSSFDFNESGELQINLKPEDPQEAETQDTDTVVPSVVSEAAPADSTVVDNQASPTEQRIASLESSLNQVVTALTQLTQFVQQGNTQTQQQQVEDEEIDFTDTSSLKKLIANEIKKNVAELITPLQNTAQKTEMYMAASEAFNKYGNDFTDKLPVIKELMSGDSTLTFEAAYQSAKKLESLFKSQSPAKQNDTTQTQTQKKPAAALAAKAASLTTVSGVTPTVAKPVASKMTLEASFEKAMEELYGRD